VGTSDLFKKASRQCKTCFYIEKNKQNKESGYYKSYYQKHKEEIKNKELLKYHLKKKNIDVVTPENKDRFIEYINDIMTKSNINYKIIKNNIV
jgi:hypothetical protein